MTLVAIIGVLLVAAGLVLWSRNRAQAPSGINTDGALHVAISATPFADAQAWAAHNYPGILSEICQIGPTGSMLPLLQGGEWAVLAHHWPGVKVGKILAYTVAAGSSPAIGSRLVHRVAEMRNGAAIMQGDTPGMPLEDWDPVTASNYIGTLVAVFKQA